MAKQLIIGLCGAAGSGKSTAAAWLEAEYGFVRVRFAGPLKTMLRAFYDSVGVYGIAQDEKVEGALKEVPCEYLGGRTPRYAMQTLGTEWGRDTVSASLWTNAWQTQALGWLRDGAPGVVVEDVRFPNEAAALRVAGGVLVRVERPGLVPIAGSHQSEAQPLSPDAVVCNNVPIEALGHMLAASLRVAGYDL